MKITESLHSLSDAQIESLLVDSLPAAAVMKRLANRSPLRVMTGFTMVELVTIMLVIAILAVVALPRFDLLKGFDEIGYRDKVKATLEYARKSAVAQRRYVCADIDASNDVTLTIESLDPEDPGHITTCPYTRELALPAADGACGAGVKNKICNPGSITLTPPATLQFDPLGRTTLGAGTYTVSGGGPITVEAETGYVH